MNTLNGYSKSTLTDKFVLTAAGGHKLINDSEFIVGTQTATTGSWTGVTTENELYDGKQITYWLPFAGSGSATLNLTFQNGTTSGAIPCYYGGVSRLTTHYGANNAIRLVYRTNVKSGNTTIEKGWWADANYIDGNTYTSAYCNTSAATAAKTATCTGYTLTANTYLHLIIVNSNTAKSALTLNVNSKGAKPIYINSVASSSSNYTLPAGTYIIFYDGTNFYVNTTGIIPGVIATANSVAWENITDKPSSFNPSSHTHDYIISKDNRSVTVTPNSYGASFRALFQSNSTNSMNDGGSFYGLIHFKPYGVTSDFSGGYPYQLAFTENQNIWFRKASSSTAWNSWLKILHSSNTHITNGVITINGSSLTPITSHQSLANYVTLNSTQTISGSKTFSSQQKFTVATGTAPFTVSSTTAVTNLNADMLDGMHANSFGLAINSFPLVKGTQTSATGAWTGTCSLQSLEDGQTIRYWLPFAGSGSATLNLTLSSGATTGAINCYYSGTTRLTTHFGANSVIILTYRDEVTINGTKYTGWWAHSQYNSDNYYSQMLAYTSVTAGTNGIKRTSLIMEDSEGNYQSLTTTSGTATTKVKNSSGFKIGGKIYYYSGSDLASSKNTGEWTTYSANLINFQYSSNCGTSLTARKMVYLVGTIENGLFYLDDAIYTQTPNDSSKVYIPIGHARYTTGYQIDFDNVHNPVIYDGTTLVPYVGNYFKVNAKTTMGTGDIYLELWRGSNASWKILNSQGYLKFQSNFTTTAGNYFDVLKLDYNTGNGTLKGQLTANTLVSNSYAYIGTSMYLRYGSVSSTYGQFYVGTRGTTTTEGVTYLKVGNDVAAGTAENSKGYLIVYGNSTGGNQIVSRATTSVINFYLPKVAGYSVYTTSTAAVGGTTTPVYIDSNGKATACSAYSTLFTDLTSTRGTNLSVTIGGTTKSITNTYAKFGVGTYTLNGGEQRPSYIESGTVRWNMMRNSTTYFDVQAYEGYCDWMMMDTYTGSDVPYVTMIGVLKSDTPHAYIASGAKGSADGKWVIKTLLDSSNSSVSGGGSTWGSSITVKLGGSNVTLTIPANPNTDTKVTNTLSTSTKFYVTGTSSATTNTGTQYFDTGVYVTTTAGNLSVGSLTSRGQITARTSIDLVNSAGTVTYGQYYISEGTTTTDGYTYLNLGNSTATGTAGNSYGILRIYNQNSGYSIIKCGTQDANTYQLFLPGASGQLVYHTNDAAIGGASTPVYVTANGEVTECNFSIGAVETTTARCHANTSLFVFNLTRFKIGDIYVINARASIPQACYDATVTETYTSTTHTSVFYLPQGYRPAQTIHYCFVANNSGNENNHATNIGILSDGRIRFWGGQHVNDVTPETNYAGLNIWYIGS